jgi:hypothetical protein
VAGFNPGDYEDAPFMRPIEDAPMSIAEYLGSLPDAATYFSRNALAIARDGVPVEHSLILAKQIQLAVDAHADDATIYGEAIAGMQMLGEAEQDVRAGNHVVTLHEQRILAALGGYSLLDRDYGMVIALRMYSPPVRSKDPELKKVLRRADCVYAPVMEVDSVLPYLAS